MRAIYFVALFFSFQPATSQELKKEYQAIVSNFINCVKSDKKGAISEMISYPFERVYPIPAIKNKQEFLKRYDEVLEASLKKMIVNSDPAKDWSEMGWRGIMLMNGDVWIDLNGRLTAIRVSDFEKTLRKKIVDEERKTLHSSLFNYLSPVCILETPKFRIRIDDLGNGYRYASWPISKSMHEKPDLILNNGEIIFDGSGGNHYYKFKNAEYTFECWITVLGTDESPPAELIITKSGKEILNQKASIVKK